jgi:ribosome biogenesis GTPase
VAAAHEGIDAALVLNKADLLREADDVQTLLARYQELGYTTITTGRDDPEAAQLTPLIANRTLVLVGQSGVGKSSLIQRLLPDHEIRIGALSEVAGKGRHTTTTAELFHLPSGADLIDSPGIREFHLHHLPPAEVASGFREFSSHAAACRFRDCLHRQGKDCAVIRAVEEGVIDTARYESYLRILDSLAD